MTSEEIKALGLRVGDVVHPKFGCRVDHVDDESGTVILHGLHYNPKLLISIERVMPGLPDGWVWIPMRNLVHFMQNEELSQRASVCSLGLLDCWEYGPDRDNIGMKMPALVAKALLEVWERTQ